MRRKQQELVTLGLSLLVLVLAAMNGARYFQRIDLTRHGVFTISEASRNLVRSIPEELSITYYLSDRLRSRAVETEQIVDLLYEYGAQSRRTVQVSVIDPASAGVSAEIENLGVAPQQIQVIEADQQSLATVYTGVVISYLDRYRSLPVVFDPRTFEYELSSAVRSIVHDYTPQIAVLLGRREEALDREYQEMHARLSRNFGVRPIEPGEPVAPDVDALFVIGGRDLSEGEVAAIDEFLARGGSVLFAVNGVAVDLDDRTLGAEAVDEQPLHDLLLEYGVRVRRELVLDEYHRRIPVARPSGAMTVQSMEPYPPWVSVVSYNDSHPASARFTGLDLYWPSPLDIDISDAGTTEILLESSARSWLMGEPFETSPLQPQAMQRDAAETRGRYVLAAAISGRRHPASRIIVVGNSEFLSNLLQYTGSGHNIDFVENVAAWLTLDEELMEIRTRAARDVRLNRIEDPVARRRVVAFAQLVNVYLVPLAVLLFGMQRYLRRRRRARVGPSEAV